MTEINPYFFSDPFIRPLEPSVLPDQAPLSPKGPDLHPEPIVQPSRAPQTEPQISKNLLDLPNNPLIVYRHSTPTSICKGPDITIPILNLEVKNACNESSFSVNCESTYPMQTPFSPIADRFEIRFFKDSFILTLTDGCGLHPSSRLAPKAAIEGFWNYLTPKLALDMGNFDVHKLGHYLKNALKAAHFNIYWDAFYRSQEGFSSVNERVSALCERLNQVPDASCLSEVLKLRKDYLLQEVEQIHRALDGDVALQKILVEKNLDTRFYENYAGATTFMCSALLKNSEPGSSPYTLLTVNLGDGQCFILRDQVLKEMTQDTRLDLSNVRDPGGKMGLCTPVPLKMDDRNLQFSLTPCQPGDLLLFMTDGVLDNLNPERLGLSPSGSLSPHDHLEKIQQAAQFSTEDFKCLLDLLNLEESCWQEVPLEKANAVKTKFVTKFLELLIQNTDSSEKANHKILDYCRAITMDHRQPYASIEEPLGKPDHTTCLTYLLPKD